MAKINPIKTDIVAHPEHEDQIVHNVEQIPSLPSEGLSASKKLTNIISNYYHSPEGVFPLDEFMYWVTDKEIIIYNRLACRLIAVGINSFTMDEIKWILDNLPQYNYGMDIAEGKHYLDFCELRNEGWMVFRVSGSNIQLIGYIRHHLDHFYNCNKPKALYHFENRDDNIIISSEEFKIIEDFIIEKSPKIPVTRITTETKSYNMLIGETVEIAVQVYPEDAYNCKFHIEPETSDYFRYTIEDDIITLTATDEGVTTFAVVSDSNPECSCEIRLEVLEYRQLLNDTYKIFRGSELYPDCSDYIELTGQITSLEVFHNTFLNRYQNVHIYDEIHVEINDPTRFVGTSMIVELIANDKLLDTLHIVYKGDVSGDGQIGGFDITLIENYLEGIYDLDNTHFIAADVDYNGIVDERDINLIKKMIQDSSTSGALIKSDLYFIVERLLGKYITNIEPGTTLKQFKSHIINDSNLINVYDKEGHNVTIDDQRLSTGMEVRFESKGHIYDKAYIVIIGDVDGNGAINLNDLSTIISNNNKVYIVKYPYTIAGDLDFTGKISKQHEDYMRDYLAGNIKSFIRLKFPDSIEVKERSGIKYIEYLNPKNTTTIEDLYNSLLNIKDVVFIYDQKNNEIADLSQKVFTGMYFTIEDKYNNLTFDKVYIVVKGDLNNDGRVSAPDYVKISNVLHNIISLNDIESIAADINNDGIVDASDRCYMNWYMAMIIDDFTNLPTISLYDNIVKVLKQRKINLTSDVINKSTKTVTFTNSKTKPVTVDLIWTQLAKNFDEYVCIYDTSHRIIYKDCYEEDSKFDYLWDQDIDVYEQLMSQELDIWYVEFSVGDIFERWTFKM